MPDRHGTVTGYTTDRCRCPSCREAWRTYARTWARERRAGTLRLTDAGEAREHLLALMGAGYSLAALESLSGLSDTAVRNIAVGKTQRVRHETAERILAVTLDAVPADHNLVPAAGTRALIGAMRRSGVLAKDITRWLGYAPGSSVPTARSPRIVVRNHRRVAVLYRLLERRGVVPGEGGL